MKLLDVNKYAVTKLANRIMLLKHLVLETAGIQAYGPSCAISCMSPLLKCSFKHIFCIVTNFSVKKQHYHR